MKRTIGLHGKATAIVHGLVLAALLILTTGCGRDAAPPLRIGILVWPPYEIALLAEDLGFYHQARIEFVDFESPAAVSRAYRDGTIDAIMVTADYLLHLAADDADQRVVLVIDFSEGGDVLMARPGIQSLAELRGHRIAVEKSALGAYVAQRALEIAGLTLSDVEIVPVDIPDQAHMYDSGQVDAVVTYEPTRTKLQLAGARELFSSRDIPGEIVDLLVTNTRVIAAHESDLHTFVRGWFAALTYLRERPADAAARVSGREGLTPAQYLQSLETARIPDRSHNTVLLSPGPESLSHSLDRHARVMTRLGTLPREIDTENLLDPRFVRPTSE